jgi:MFS family permease
LLAFAAVYGFTALGDSSVLSTAMSEAVPADYLGRALAIRSILGIGIGAAAPAAFGAVLDRAPPDQAWGWAFALMGLGGIVAAVCAVLLPGTARSSAFPGPAPAGAADHGPGPLPLSGLLKRPNRVFDGGSSRLVKRHGQDRTDRRRR